jgi:hypothetical protein
MIIIGVSFRVIKVRLPPSSCLRRDKTARQAEDRPMIWDSGFRIEWNGTVLILSRQGGRQSFDFGFRNAELGMENLAHMSMFLPGRNFFSIKKKKHNKIRP